MEEETPSKSCDHSLCSDGASPYATTSVSEDSSCELSPDVSTAGPSADAELSELPIGGGSDEKQSSPIARLMERTGYSIVQQNGQRRYGPPPDWEGQIPTRGCEVFVGKIPRDCFEDELVPVFEKAGKIYELRLMMDYNGQNRGYAFVVYGSPADAKDCVRRLNNYEIRKGRTLGVCMSVDNCRLFVGGIPKKVTKEDIRQEMQKVTEGVVDVIVYPSAADKTKNRGFAFVEYESHRAAAMARRKLMNGRVYLWGHQLAVDWAEPELEVDEEIMAQVKVLYVRNLMLSTTESTIEEVFSQYAPVERVKKIRDYAFVHFHSREDAHKTMNALNGSILDDAEIEVMLAKPVDKDTYPRSPKFNRVTAVPAVSFIPVDNYGTLLPAIYPGSYPLSPKYMVRNSMGACTMVRMSRGGRGRGRGFLPVQMMQPNPRLVLPTSPVQTPFYPTTQSYFDARKCSEDQLQTGYVEVQATPPPSVPTVTAQGQIVPKPSKNRVQFLEEVCMKNSWSAPLYTFHTTYGTGDNRLYVNKVTLPSLGISYMPHKLSRTPEEAKCVAAEYALSQLGYCTEVPVTAAAYSTTAPQHLPIADSSPTYPTAAFITQTPPKPATWGGLPEAAIYSPSMPEPFPSPQAFSAHQDLYHQPLPHQQHGF